MRRIMLTVAYDGTNYNGWQIQPGVPTIEGVLNEQLSKLLKEDIKVIGASRTDAGVHAEGAVAVFDTDSRIEGEKFSYALNQFLPDDIVIRRSEEVADDFHPRRVACIKTYRYSIWHDIFPMPTMSRYKHWIHYPLQIGAMEEAALFFRGEYDFAAFCAAATDVESTVRTITDISVESSRQATLREDGRLYYGNIDIMVSGNGFLYNMVRIIAGTIIEAGTGRIKPSDIPGIIESRDRSRAGDTAPAKGLTLVGYRYERG